MRELTTWLKWMVKKYFIIIPFLFSASLYAQDYREVTIEKANELARENYPLIQQKNLLQQTANITIDNLSKKFLPQFTLNGQASYQSDVTKIDLPITGFSIEGPAKDQYKIFGDANVLLFDGGMISAQKKSTQLKAGTEAQKIEVELYKLQERVNQIFTGILFLEEQLKQVSLRQKDIQTGIDKMEARLKNGVAFRSNLSELKAEYLQSDQRKIELNAGKSSLIKTLELLMNVHFSDSVVFKTPVVTTNFENVNERPEMKLFADQNVLLDQQKSLIKAGNMPKASLFLQGGYGRPTFNFLKNDFDFFYIGGIRFTWPLNGLYTRKNDLELIEIDKKTNSIQEATFLLNMQTQLTQEQSEIEKMTALIQSDEEIIQLRESVKEAAKVQLENGVITSGDFLREVNAEDQARQALITHQVELLQAKIYYQTLQGKKYE